MRTAVLTLVILLAAGCAASSTGTTDSGPKSNVQCDAERHAIERGKYAANQAGAAGDSVEANKQRQEVEMAAQIARGIADCDISDLVGDNVGR